MSKPKAPETVTPQSQMTPAEKALNEKMTGISSQYADILSQQYPSYQIASQQAAQYLPERLETSRMFEQQAKELLPKVSVLSPEFQKSLNDRLGVLKQQAQTTLSDIYAPQEQQTKQRLYGQLGGLRSSIAGDIMGKLEKERVGQANNFALAIEADRAQQEQQQLANQQAALGQLMSGAGYFGELGLGGLQGAYSPATQSIGTGISTGSELANRGINLANAINSANSQAFQNQILASQNSPWSRMMGMAAQAGGAYYGSKGSGGK